jgi:hypothetical protein
MLAIATCVLLIGAPYAWNQIRFYQESVTAVGEVTRLTYGAHHANAVFTATNGHAYQLSISSIQAFDKGDAVVIRYTAADPARSAVLDDFLNIWLVTTFYLAVVVSLFYFGISGRSIKQKGVSDL